MSKRSLSRKTLVGTSLLALAAGFSQTVLADAIADALTGGKIAGDINLRYESVDQDNSLKDADALTIRTLLTYTTGTVSGFTGVIGFHDVRTVVGLDDYNSTTNGKGSYSVIADPETTELDQGFIQYKTGMVTAKLGRQVITFDNHRFVGHVGWRQDRQTFDGITFSVTPMEGLTLNYGYVDERNRIFAEAQDVDSSDHLLNAAYKTPFGTLTGYGYFLEWDDSSELTIDTVGIRFAGAAEMDGMKLLYTAEYATQDKDNAAGVDASADYMLLEGGVSAGIFTAKVGYEVLGSDNGAYGFSTPLATLHAFNGWADQFLATPNEGLVDTYVSVGAKIPGAGMLTGVYHEFEADDASASVDDLGDEVDIVYAHTFSPNYSAGIKLAMYSAGDIKVDTDKLWVWVGVKF